ncbi:MAG: helicase [Sphingomonadales bacterium]|nr:helicase [Sphingomonadales bacterium]
MDSKLVAVLGPTNTGKTHLAIERMCAHSSGMIGFPLRLLAREVYDRVVAIKGAGEVGLITGEEKILPPKARWLLCTAESMPMDRDVAFLALDEAQIGADPERGHVFTDRMLHARGREETMILGSEALGGMVRALMPKAEITRRPRFSTLSYAGAKKLSRLPKRSAIVAFSAEEVYAVAEMLRRARGGAAVVMGALSPRTRNAQVAMFQAGEVDYLVATDAIGMGLNMDLNHVAFASLSKFDGHRQRRLTVGEMAQIAGRAGRHQRDGTFGSLGGEEMFRPEEIEAIEEHRFPRIEHLYWRDGNPDVSSLPALIAALEAKPDRFELRAAPEAVDLAVLKRLADDPLVIERARHPSRVARLWEACGLPDFRKVGPEHHARTVQRVYRHLTEGSGHIPTDWFAGEIARLDEVGGDIPALGGRIAAARTWAYIAHRADWLADPKHWAARTEALEEKLSDALHKKLTERFVDRRTTVLMREIGADPAMLDVAVAEDGIVSVEDEPIGRLDGFAFTVDPSARVGERKRLLAAAERRLPKERARRAQALVDSPDMDFALMSDPIGIAWRGVMVARLAPGRTLLEPRIIPDPAIGLLSVIDRERVGQRIENWLAGTLTRHLKPLFAMAATGGDLFTPPRVRALLAPLAAGGGTMDRSGMEGPLNALDSDDRRILRAAGLTVGTLDLYDSRLLKPEPMRLVAALSAVRAKSPMPALPAPGATVTEAPGALPGFRKVGAKQVRIDLIERIARALHDRRQAKLPFVPDPALATSFGVDAATFEHILRACGFRAENGGNWVWRSRPRAAPSKATPQSPHFAALEGWARRV